MKKCRICYTIKDDSLFARSSKKRGYKIQKECKACVTKRAKLWNKKNKEKRKAIYTKSYYKCHTKRKESSLKAFRKKHFGGLWLEVLKRDCFKCVGCGISLTEHLNKWGFFLEIDHIDKDRQNNNLTNLQTLCCICHGKKHIKKAEHGRLYTSQDHR
jgi:hypothetical protein